MLPHVMAQNIPILFAEFKHKANRYAASVATLFNFCDTTPSTYICPVNTAREKVPMLEHFPSCARLVKLHVDIYKAQSWLSLQEVGKGHKKLLVVLAEKID